MEHLGLCGIIKLTITIVLRHPRHFLCIALLLALPYAFNFLVFGPNSWKLFQSLVASASFAYKLLTASPAQFNPSDFTPSDPTPLSNPPHHSLILLSIFAILTSFLCTLLLTFSVCRACINKALDLKGSLRGVPRSAKDFFLTVLVMFAVLFTFFLVVMAVMAIIAVGLLAVHANIGIPMIIMTIGVMGAGLYVAILFSLAKTVAILEEKVGWEAMRRSMYLIRGSRGIAAGLYIIYGVLSVAALCVNVSEDASVVWRWGAGALSVGVQATIALCSMASQVVLYMSCKRGHGEPLDALRAASAQFGPQEMATKYLDIEAAALATTID